MNLTEAELATLNAANTDDEWNAACLAIKRAHGNTYPPDWLTLVHEGGVFDAFKRRSGTPNIQVL